MAKETATTLFIGTDHQFKYHIQNDAETAALDVTGWALSWMIKRSKNHSDAEALLTKTTTGGGVVIAGTFNADPALNLQRATVSIFDTDTDGQPAGVRYYELKRMDAGSETILAYGELELLRSVHHA